MSSTFAYGFKRVRYIEIASDCHDSVGDPTARMWILFMRHIFRLSRALDKGLELV